MLSTSADSLGSKRTSAVQEVDKMLTLHWQLSINSPSSLWKRWPAAVEPRVPSWRRSGGVLDGGVAADRRGEGSGRHPRGKPHQRQRTGDTSEACDKVYICLPLNKSHEKTKTAKWLCYCLYIQNVIYVIYRADRYALVPPHSLLSFFMCCVRESSFTFTQQHNLEVLTHLSLSLFYLSLWEVAPLTRHMYYSVSSGLVWTEDFFDIVFGSFAFACKWGLSVSSSSSQSWQLASLMHNITCIMWVGFGWIWTFWALWIGSLYWSVGCWC